MKLRYQPWFQKVYNHIAPGYLTRVAEALRHRHLPQEV